MAETGTGAAPHWTLLGRDEAVSTALRCLREGLGTVLVGAAGVGKTRLAREICDRVAQRGRHVLHISATRSARSIPLGALAAHLPVPGDRTADLAEQLRLAGDALRGIATPGNLVLSIDNAHLLDDASATVVHQLAFDGGAIVVATVRQGDPCPDAILTLWKDGHARRVDVLPLDREITEALIAGALQGPVDGMTAKVLWDNSRGNPLYLRELIEGALEAGLLSNDSGLWRLSRRAGANPRLVDLVDARLAGLDSDDRSVLTVLAVGDDLPVRVFEDMGHAHRVPALEAAGLIETHRDRRRWSVRIGHPVHQQVLLHQLGERQQEEITRDLAQRLGQFGARRRDDVLRLAMWRLTGADPIDPELMTEAARRVSVMHDDELAVRLSEVAIADGAGLDAALINGAGLARLGRTEEAEDVLGAIDVGEAADDRKVIVTVARSDNLFWALGRAETAQEVIAATRRIITDPAADAELGVNAAVYSFMRGRPGEAIETLEPVIAAAPDRVVVTAAMSLAPSLAATGRGEEGATLVERAIGIRAGLDEGVTRLTEEPMLRMAHGFVLIAAGQIDAALTTARTGYDLAVEHHDRHGEAWCSMIIGSASMAAGQVESAARWAGEAAAKFRDVGMDGLARVCIAGRMHSVAVLGQADEAAALREQIEAAPPGFPALEPEVIRFLAWEDAMRGDPDAAVELLFDAADRSAQTGAVHVEALALHDVARLGRSDAVSDRLVTVTQGQQSAIAAALASHAVSAVSGDGTGLEAAADVFAAAGARLLAAEAAAQAAAVHHGTGDARSARHCARRSAELLTGLGPIKTPLLTLAGDAGRLTPREREVATACASGLSNQEVADRLGVSVRTVETHLHRVYAKLATDRAGLADAIRSPAVDEPDP